MAASESPLAWQQLLAPVGDVSIYEQAAVRACCDGGDAAAAAADLTAPLESRHAATSSTSAGAASSSGSHTGSAAQSVQLPGAAAAEPLCTDEAQLRSAAAVETAQPAPAAAPDRDVFSTLADAARKRGAVDDAVRARLVQDSAALRAAVAKAAASAAALEAASCLFASLPEALQSASAAAETTAQRAATGVTASHAGAGAGPRALPPGFSTGRRSSLAGADGWHGRGGGSFGAGSGSGSSSGLTTTALSAPRLRSFLAAVLPRVEEALQQGGGPQHHQDPVCSDAAALLFGAHDAGSAAGDWALSDTDPALAGDSIAGTGVREDRQLGDLQLSAGRAVTATAWHPLAPAVPWLAVAVAPAQQPTERRLAHAALPVPHRVLLYTSAPSADGAVVQAVLEAPGPVTALQWCPADTGGNTGGGSDGGPPPPPSASWLLAAGTSTGQVCLFDVGQEVGGRGLVGAGAAVASQQHVAGRRPSATDAAGTSLPEAGAGAYSGVGSPAVAAVAVLRPKHASSPEASHAGAVVSVQWLPPSHQLSHSRHTFTAASAHRSSGDVATAPTATGAGGAAAATTQFLTVGADGVVAVWDTTYQARYADKGGGKRTRRRLSSSLGFSGGSASGGGSAGANGTATTTSTTAATAGADDGSDQLLLVSALVPGAAAAGVLAPQVYPHELPWAPHYRVATRLPVTAAAALAPGRPSDPLLVGTRDGCVAAINWAPPGEGTHADGWGGATTTTAAGSGGGAAKAATAPAGATNDDGNRDGASGTTASPPVVLWTSPVQAGAGPVRYVARSPFQPDLMLAVADGRYSLWARGCGAPLLTSPPSPAPLVCGAWSPSRPGVLLAARADGVLEVADLYADAAAGTSSAAASAPAGAAAVLVPLVSHALTTLEFVGGGPQAQRVAVGDARGSVFVLSLPPLLRRSSSGSSEDEGRWLDAFVAREMQRWASGQAQAARLRARNAKTLADAEAAATRRAAERAGSAEADATALAEAQRAAAAAAAAAAEERYRALEAEAAAALG
jgi:hypothetical protein